MLLNFLFRFAVRITIVNFLLGSENDLLTFQCRNFSIMMLVEKSNRHVPVCLCDFFVCVQLMFNKQVNQICHVAFDFVGLTPDEL